MLPWALHFLAVYVLQALACARGWPEPATRLAMAGVTVLAMAALTWIGARAWRRRQSTLDHAGGALMAWLVLALAALALVATIFTTLPILLLTPCE